MRQVYRYCILIFVLLNVSSLAPAEDIEEWMPDANLRAAVREALELPDDVPLTKEHLKELTVVVAWDSGINDLTGLEQATDLKVFIACGNQITDLSLLAGLIHLEHLSLCGNGISDISPLSELMNLKSLDIGGNQLSDISPLSDLIQLETLNIGYNLVEDITPLANLTQLSFLRADSNMIDNISLLAGFSNLKELILTNNRISDFSPLVNLMKLEKLYIRENFEDNIKPLLDMNLIVFEYDEVCEIAPPQPSIEERVRTRTFPSVCQAWANLLIEGLSEDESIAYHDLHFSPYFTLQWDLATDNPTQGLSTQLAGNLDIAKTIRQRRLRLNPNMVFLFALTLFQTSEGAFPEDSDFWLRDDDGQIAIKDVNRPWLEYQIDFVKSHVQGKLVEKIVGIAKCGLYDGIFLDGFAHNGTGFVGRELHPATDAEIIAATTRILREVRSQVRDDFLILINASRSKPTAYNEYVNGSFMELGRYHSEGYTYRELTEIEGTLLWNEENLRAPQVNCLEGEGDGTEPPDSPNNRRWMRVFTTMSLTHSDGYVLYNTGERIFEGPDHAHIWYDFWDIDLGKPIGEKAQHYGDGDGLFIREFTNGWAVYNRSGRAQTIQLPMRATGVESDVPGTQHTVPDLDGEIILKLEPGTPADGVIKVLDSTTVDTQELASKWMPDVNLRTAVIEAIGLPEDVPLKKEHLKWLSRLSVWETEISDLTGLEHAVNLQNFGACRNQITDLSPLAELILLERLSLCVNQISDISPLAELTNLKSLDLGGNQISDIMPLANLIQLETLNIGYNLVEDITPLTHLKQLSFFGAGSNKIDNISLLAGLSNLTELVLTNNRISDFSPLVNLVKLEKLYIKGNLGGDIKPLFNLDLIVFEYDESQLETEPSTDVNDDGEVNILDLVAVANAFGEAEPDLNGDGVVNIQDLVIVANAFEQ